MLCERVFIGQYDTNTAQFGNIGIFDGLDKPPRTGRPSSMLGFAQLIAEITKTYNVRQSPVFEWADAEPEIIAAPPVEPEESSEGD